MKETTGTSAGTVLKWSIALTIYYLIAAIFSQDIGLHDESTFYLSQKDRLTLGSFFTQAEYGPLYAAWYKVIAWVVRDNIALYFASWGLLVALSVELMRRATQSVGSIIPVLIALGLPIFKVSPYVGLFASAVLMLGFIAAKTRKSADAAVIVTAVAGLCAGLARPEFLYAPSMLLLGCVAHAVIRKRPAAKTILVCLLIAALGIFISRSSDTGRGVVAFEQHFNLRASERGEMGNEFPWTSRHARELFFKNSDKDVKYKLSDYVKAAPMEVVKHIARNAIDPRTLMLGLAAVAIAFFLFRAGQPFGAMYVAVMALPPLISCTLIYPRNHYIVSILMTLLAGACIAGAHLLSGHDKLKRLKGPVIVVLVLLVFVFSLNIKALRTHPKGIEEHVFSALHPVASTLLEMRELEQQANLRQPLVIFEPYGGVNIYLHRTWKWVAEFHLQSGRHFLEMIRAHGASVFMVNDYVIAYYHLTPEEVAQAFRESGYSVKPCTYMACNIYIAPN